MPIVSFNERLPQTYLERFQPEEGLPYRISVLALQGFAHNKHWVDIGGTKGSYECKGGICCHAFGRPMQNYCVPIWVYRNPASIRNGQWLQSGLIQGADGNMTPDCSGDLLVWQLSSSQWQRFTALSQQIDLSVYDLALTASKKGGGQYSGSKDLNYSAVPDLRLRDYWPADQKQQVAQMVDGFFKNGEASLVTAMTDESWTKLLYEVGYDTQNNCWPGGVNPMDMARGMGAVRQGFSQSPVGSYGAPQAIAPLGMAPALAPPPAFPKAVAAPVQNTPTQPSQGLTAASAAFNPAPVTPASPEAPREASTAQLVAPQPAKPSHPVVAPVIPGAPPPVEADSGPGVTGTPPVSTSELDSLLI